MNREILFEIESSATMVKDNIGKARFMANLAHADFFTYEKERNTIAARYDSLKTMSEILFDYVIASDERIAELQGTISQAFDENGA